VAACPLLARKMAAAAAVGLAGALLMGAGPELPERAVAYSVAVLRAASDAACFPRQLAAEKVFSLCLYERQRR